MILYGTNPIAWANDDDRSIGADIPTDRILDEAGRQIGFDGIENGHRWPEDPVELRETLGAYGLQVDLRLVLDQHCWSARSKTRSPPSSRISPSSGRTARGSASSCETSNTVHGDPVKPVNDKPVLSAGEMTAFGAKIEAFAAYMAAQGIDLAYHHHMGTVVESPDEIDAFMAATGPATKLLFDAGHCDFGGGDPVDVLNRHVTRSVHVHAKNVRADVAKRVRDEDLSFLDGVLAGAFTVPGDQEGVDRLRPAPADPRRGRLWRRHRPLAGDRGRTGPRGAQPAALPDPRARHPETARPANRARPELTARPRAPSKAERTDPCPIFW